MSINLPFDRLVNECTIHLANQFAFLLHHRPCGCAIADFWTILKFVSSPFPRRNREDSMYWCCVCVRSRYLRPSAPRRLQVKPATRLRPSTAGAPPAYQWARGAEAAPRRAGARLPWGCSVAPWARGAEPLQLGIPLRCILASRGRHLMLPAHHPPVCALGPILLPSPSPAAGTGPYYPIASTRRCDVAAPQRCGGRPSVSHRRALRAAHAIVWPRGLGLENTCKTNRSKVAAARDASHAN